MFELSVLQTPLFSVKFLYAVHFIIRLFSNYQENITRSPFHPEVMDLTLERVTPINRYFRIRRQQVKIVEPEKKETNDDTKNNLLNQV